MSPEAELRPALVVGPLCHYFAGADATAAAGRVAGVEAWRRDTEAAVGHRVRGALDWAEDPALEVATTPLGAGLDAVRLLAVYAERPELEFPDAVPTRLAGDPAWAAGLHDDFANTKYGHVLAAACWLPADFDFTFRAPRPDGAEWTFGSLAALCDQLHFLDARTFDTAAEQRAALAAAPLPPGRAFAPLARVGLARWRLAVEDARQRGQVLAVRDA